MTGPENGGKTHGGKARNLLEQWLPLNTVILLACFLASGGYGVGLLKESIDQHFNSADQKLQALDAQNTAIIVRLNAIDVTMRDGKAARDGQIRDINGRIDDLTAKQETANDQLTTLRLQVSNIVQDLAILKCKVGKC